MKGILALPVGWQVWVHALAMLNLLVPLFFLSHVEAQWVLAAFVAGFVTGVVLVRRWGFSKLLGLMHVYWLPLLVWLWGRLDAVPAGEPLGIWLRVLIVMNAVSLLIDMTDVFRYFSAKKVQAKPGGA